MAGKGPPELAPLMPAVKEAHRALKEAKVEVSGSDLTAAGSLGPCAPDYSVSFNPYVGAYTLLYVEGETKTLRMRTASSPAGPFGLPATIGTLAHDEASELVYMAFEHPAFREEDGRVVHLSYSQPRFARNSLVRLRFR